MHHLFTPYTEKGMELLRCGTLPIEMEYKNNLHSILKSGYQLSIYVPWLVCPADNLIDWNTQEDYEETLISQKEWLITIREQMP